MPVKIAVLGNLTRLEMDITKQRGPKSSDEVLVSYFKDMKTAGSDESVSIFNPDKKSTFLILPRLKVYLQTPIPKEQLEQVRRRPLAEKTESGKGQIDGHACTKYTVKFTGEHSMDVWRTWETSSGMVWVAQDVSACPLRVDVLSSDGGTNCTIQITSVEPTKPDRKLFEPPKGFTKCETPDALLKIIMEHWPNGKTQ
jgi:hypothetical protein